MTKTGSLVVGRGARRDRRGGQPGARRRRRRRRASASRGAQALGVRRDAPSGWWRGAGRPAPCADGRWTPTDTSARARTGTPSTEPWHPPGPRRSPHAAHRGRGDARRAACRGARTRTFLVELCRDGDEAQAVYKPVRGERPLVGLPERLARARGGGVACCPRRSGWGIVPPTVLRDDGPLGEGSLQLFVPADFEQHYFTLHEDAATHDRAASTIARSTSSPTTPIARAGTACSATTDASTGIDNGLCFARRAKLRTVIWEFGGEPIPPSSSTMSRRIAEGGAARHRRAARSRRGRCGAPPVEGDRGEADLPRRHLGAALSLADGVTSLERARRGGRPRRAGADGRSALLDAGLGWPRRAAGSVPLGARTGKAAVAGGVTRRVPARARGAGAMGRECDHRGRRSLRARPVAGGRGEHSHVGRARTAPRTGSARCDHGARARRPGRGSRRADESIDRSVLEVPLALCRVGAGVPARRVPRGQGRVPHAARRRARRS